LGRRILKEGKDSITVFLRITFEGHGKRPLTGDMLREGKRLRKWADSINIEKRKL